MLLGKEPKLRPPIHFYETVAAAFEAEAEESEFAGICPDCREDDPFLRLMDGIAGAQKDPQRKTR